MSSSRQTYTTLPGTIDPQQMCGDVTTAGTVSNEWYAPTSYAYENPYNTPFPSSTIESQPWPAYARASIPDISTTQHQHMYAAPSTVTSYVQYSPNLKDPSRPRSSPSTFGPSVENIAWPGTSNGLGINYAHASNVPTPPVTSTFPPAVFQYPIEDQQYSTSTASPPEIRHPQPRRSYPNIAPVPPNVPSTTTSLATIKRSRPSIDEDDRAETSSNSGTKRRKRTSSVASADMSEDDRYLVQLKEDEALPWKDIATRFHQDKGKNFQVAALQMRYKRLREKYRMWEEQDLSALRSAHEYWDKYKWEIISAKMLDFGLTERWPPRHCARKFQELESMAATHHPTTTAGLTPGISHSQYSSPVDAPMHFAFMPIS